MLPETPSGQHFLKVLVLPKKECFFLLFLLILTILFTGKALQEGLICGNVTLTEKLLLNPSQNYIL